MIWLTWRQFRLQAWVMSAFLGVLAITLAVTGVRLAHLYHASGLAACTGNGGCATIAGNFLTAARNDPADFLVFDGSVVVMYVLPALIGVFWGAPLVTREIEAGTHRLAWNQSVTRTHWLAVKLGLLGLAAMAAGGLLSLGTTWWVSPLNRAAWLAGGTRAGAAQVTRLNPLMFGAHGIAPAGYAAFAFALGVAAGVLIRRTVPAMAVTLAIFAAVQVIWPQVVRPYLIPPVSVSHLLDPGLINGLNIDGPGSVTVFSSVNLPGAWVITNHVAAASGQAFTGPVPAACKSSSFQACAAALGRLHLRQVLTYQPASRYWALQGYETAIFLGLALALAGFCFWWTGRHRIA